MHIVYGAAVHSFLHGIRGKGFVGAWLGVCLDLAYRVCCQAKVGETHLLLGHTIFSAAAVADAQISLLIAANFGNRGFLASHALMLGTVDLKGHGKRALREEDGGDQIEAHVEVLANCKKVPDAEGMIFGRCE